MDETMVRTQVYLSRKVYNELRARAKARHLTMAVQIREALGEYIQRTQAAADGGSLRPDDPIFQLAGMFSGPRDLSESHDHYLYGAAKRQTLTAHGPTVAARERPVGVYGSPKAKPRTTKKKRTTK